MKSTGALCLVMALGSVAFGQRVSFDTRPAWQEWAHSRFTARAFRPSCG